MLENEKGIVGDTVARRHALLTAVGRADLGFAWDTANFIQVGEARLVERGWPLLGHYIEHVHVKDAFLADGKVCVAGAGEGQMRELLAALRGCYRGFLAWKRTSPSPATPAASAGRMGWRRRLRRCGS